MDSETQNNTLLYQKVDIFYYPCYAVEHEEESKMKVTVTRARHRWTERAGFVLERPEGVAEYIFLHFLSPVDLTFEGQTLRTEKNDFIVFSPGTPHCIAASGPLLHDWLHLTGDMSALMQYYGLQVNQLYHSDPNTGVSEMIQILENEYFAQRPYWEELAYAKLNEMLIRLSYSVNDGQFHVHVRNETVEHLREIRSRILLMPWHSWSVSELAQEVNLSQSRLHAVYKAVFGISPRQDLILVRIEKAKILLQSGAAVSSVADQLGYGSVYHFIRQFKQIVGSTPKQFSKRSAQLPSEHLP